MDKKIDSRKPMLQIDLDSIEVCLIQEVTYKGAPHRVTRVKVEELDNSVDFDF